MARNLITPDRQSPLQSEFAQVIGDLQIHMVFGVFLAAEIDYRFVRQFNLFSKMAEHHGASQRRRKIRHQYPVIAARAGAGDGAGSVTAKSVRYEPLSDKQQHRIGFFAPAPGHSIQDEFFSRLRFFHNGSLSRTSTVSPVSDHWPS